MNHRCLVNLCVVVLSLSIAGALAWAQATGGFAGRVTDESGAVLPGVTVTATQTNTGFTRTSVTDGTGGWTMPNLPVGPYRLEISLQGFRSYVQTGIVLQVEATPTINAVLALGSLEETVTVEAAAPLVDVRSAGIGAVVDQEQIVALPLQGRQVTDLIVLAGAAIQTGRPNTKNFQGGVTISVAGGMDAGVGYMLDGAMHNDVSNAGGLPLPFPDALQEFRVATSGLAAQNGMHAGASVNAVTKSGTNVFHGNAFEFLRDRRLNATHPFAAIGPDGKPEDDGLRRNQYGGTVGGPIVQDRLFFFGGYQGTFTRVSPTSEIAYVPTAAMLAGDFTAITSPACNNGRQITLGGDFVNNQIDPALFSPAALNLAARLPTTTDPCGETKYGSPNNLDDRQVVGRIDYQVSTNNSVFGRYMATSHKAPSSLSLSPENILGSHVPGVDNLAQSMTLGNTVVIGNDTVNALRFAYNRTVVDRANQDFFEASDLGIKIFNNSLSRETIFRVSDGFEVSESRATKGLAENNAFQLNEELTLVRGAHQLVVGANVGYWKVRTNTFWPGGGQFVFDGGSTGLGLADFMVGDLSQFTHGGKSGVAFHQLYQGYFLQDEWRATDRVTVNAGLRWEPFFGQQITGAVANFDIDKFRQGVKSTVFVNAPAGFIYPGDADFPSGKSGFDKQWWNFAPRVGIAWDASGDGRTAVRASYGIAYDFPEGETWFTAAAGPPYGNRVRFNDPPGGLDDPYGHLGGDPNPIATNRDTVFPRFGQMAAVDPDINSPRVQQWNVTVEQQLGTTWSASASYLGSYSDRFWGIVELNPGTNRPGSLNTRRALYLENPEEAQFISNLNLFDDLSTQNYRGLKISVRRRSTTGVNLSGNWTWGRCYGLQLGRGGGGGSGSGGGGAYGNPDDIDYDRGHCDWDRTHLANLSLGYQAPELSGGVLQTLASDWRVSGIVGANSGRRFDVQTGVTAFNGLALARRVNQVSDDVYGEKTLDQYLNRAAFENPPRGTFGNHEHNSLAGPGFWKVDLAVSRLFRWGGAQSLEARLEAFNLFNNFNWGMPNANFRSGSFGRITTMTGDPRILQLGIKYGF